jgi:hypothetical protein
LNSGTVFRLALRGKAGTSVIYSFNERAGRWAAHNGVTLDAQGNLYGTAVTGGTGQACEAAAASSTS